MNEKNPPKSVKVKWCPRCGRDDRWTPFTGKSHLCFIGGSSAQRVPNHYLVTLTYEYVRTPDVPEERP